VPITPQFQAQPLSAPNFVPWSRMVVINDLVAPAVHGLADVIEGVRDGFESVLVEVACALNFSSPVPQVQARIVPRRYVAPSTPTATALHPAQAKGNGVIGGPRPQSISRRCHP